MANYIIESCDGLIEIVVNPGDNEITTGNTYYINFTGETDPGCFTVVSESEEPIDEGISSALLYNNCLECLQDNNFSFLVSACTVTGLSGPVNSSQFNEWPLGDFYSLCANNGEFEGCLCFEVVGIQDTLYPFEFIISGPYSDCECQGFPRSANTESTICLEVCGPDGNTVIVVNPPHPVWTDAYGVPVTQLNMITLGGINGLNN